MPSILLILFTGWCLLASGLEIIDLDICSVSTITFDHSNVLHYKWNLKTTNCSSTHGDVLLLILTENQLKPQSTCRGSLIILGFQEDICNYSPGDCFLISSRDSKPIYGSITNGCRRTMWSVRSSDAPPSGIIYKTNPTWSSLPQKFTISIINISQQSFTDDGDRSTQTSSITNPTKTSTNTAAIALGTAFGIVSIALIVVLLKYCKMKQQARECRTPHDGTRNQEVNDAVYSVIEKGNNNDQAEREIVENQLYNM
uniref:uncharacterized protein LOC120330137 n=1 Tax=Styela clava TaxID=7725 RepID=UPI001939650B|nr:uncharacterized protein LOC120330137 [Styela clava]